jgi:hypothetical protein
MSHRPRHFKNPLKYSCQVSTKTKRSGQSRGSPRLPSCRRLHVGCLRLRHEPLDSSGSCHHTKLSPSIDDQVVGPIQPMICRWRREAAWPASIPALPVRPRPFCFDSPALTWVKAVGLGPRSGGLDRQCPPTRLLPLTHGKILIIEDDPAVGSSLKFALEVEGFLARAYQTGAELLNDTDIPEDGCHQYIEANAEGF